MRIVIVGPGAIGTLFAALLAKAKPVNEVWLLDKDPQRAKRLALSGLKVEGISDFKVQVNVTADARDIQKANLVIIAVKSYDTEAAVKSIMPILTEETKVLTIQNGIGNLEIITELVGQQRALGGITAHGATLIREGCVKHAGSDETTIGRPDGKIFGDVRAVANIFNDAKIETKMSKDIKAVIWSKLIVNVGVNALAALTRLCNGHIAKIDYSKEILRQSVSEAVRVAKRKGIKLLYDDPLQKTESVCAATSTNVCSMLQDVLSKKPTEIDFINGAISRHGRSLGIKTPVNDMLFALIKTIESSYDKQINKCL